MPAKLRLLIFVTYLLGGVFLLHFFFPIINHQGTDPTLSTDLTLSSAIDCIFTAYILSTSDNSGRYWSIILALTLIISGVYKLAGNHPPNYNIHAIYFISLGLFMIYICFSKTVCDYFDEKNQNE